MPIINFIAHNNSGAARKLKSDQYAGLSYSIYCSINSKINLTSNLWTSTGLVNSAGGTIKDIIVSEDYKPGDLPEAVIIEFLDYTGPQLFDEPHKKNYIPINPKSSFSKTHAATRTLVSIRLEYEEYLESEEEDHDDNDDKTGDDDEKADDQIIRGNNNYTCGILSQRIDCCKVDKKIENLLFTSKQTCFEANAIKIRDIQNSCGENLKTAAEAMAMQHIHKLGEAKVADTVQVSVPDVDRGPADPVNILAFITKIKNHKLYQLATKYGIIKV
ncbi:ATP-dependent DNA helicase pif1 [Brachionus plicatilis]|uniref:ATP-dependent DNA helicase pif1 n=1 Tax=Brachionus plicatilis TaxID=10195 RepID=A0A3M7S905_BRAPC|nr:ATP-dependent DNA helicase pif1 [Brachionus plicatilis]